MSQSTAGSSWLPLQENFRAEESCPQPAASKALCCLQLGGVAGMWWRAQCNAIVLPVPGFALLGEFKLNIVLICSSLAAA